MIKKKNGNLVMLNSRETNPVFFLISQKFQAVQFRQMTGLPWPQSAL